MEQAWCITKVLKNGKVVNETLNDFTVSVNGCSHPCIFGNNEKFLAPGYGDNSTVVQSTFNENKIYIREQDQPAQAKNNLLIGNFQYQVDENKLTLWSDSVTIYLKKKH